MVLQRAARTGCRSLVSQPNRNGFMHYPDLLLRNVRTFLQLASGTAQGCDVLISQGRIAQIGPHVVAPAHARVLDCSSRLLAPGLVNAHWHSPMQAAHGTADRLDHKRFMWLNQADTANRSQEEIATSALLGCIQMIRSGTTSVIDHFPEQGFEVSDVAAVVDALERSGMRAVVALRVFDGEYSDIMPEAAQATPALTAAIRDHNPLVPRSLAQSMALLEACITSFDGRAGRIRVFPAPSNPVRCSDAFLIACQEMAERFDTGIHCHMLETRRQATLAQDQYGRSMVAHMAALGALDSRWSCAHCNWLTDDDIALMAQRGAVAVLNPESNLKIGSGVPPITAFLRAGLTCALGTDGASTNDNLVLQEAMQLAALLHRTSEPDHSQWVSAADVLRMGTTGGAAALREPELGQIAVGQKADLVLYDLNSAVWTPCNDPLQQFVFGERGANVRSVIIDGRLVMDEGVILTFDEAAVLQNARHLLQDTRERNAGIRLIADAFGPAP